MTDSRATFPIRRFLLEAVVIVVSILLAFAIEAWWSEAQEAEEEARILETIANELHEIAEIAEEQTRHQTARAERIDRLLGQLGPDAVATDPRAFWEDLGGIIRTGLPLLATGGIDGVFESGALQLVDDLELRRRLVDWRARRQYFEGVADFTDDYTDTFNAYLIEKGVAGALPELRPSGSAFTLDPETLMRDPVFESLLVYLRAIVSQWVVRGPELSGDVADLATYVDSLRAVR